MKTLWEDPNYSDPNLCSWEVAYESAMDIMDENPDYPSVGIAEYRPSEVSDICVEELTDEIWECLDDLLRTQTDFGHDDGWPNLESLKGPIVAGRPKAWEQLKTAIEQVLADHLDMSEAAWHQTGRVRRVSRDGDAYKWEDVEP
jgi:hypothetical protein